MSKETIQQYADNQLRQGKSQQEIRQELLSAGWQQSVVDDALGTNQITEVPVPSAPPSPPQTPTEFTPTDPQKLDPKAVWLFTLQNSLSFVFIFIFFILPAAFATDAAGILILIGLLVVGAFSYVWARLVYRFYRYELSAEGFRKELGVISKKYVTIPYDRIQNVDINRSLLSRFFGLSSLSIQTAGAASSSKGFGAEGKLPAVSKEVAEQLRSELISRARAAGGRGGV